MELGEKIKNARQSKKLTQKKFGELLGVTNTTVSKWESNTNIPDVAQVQKMADILGKDMNYFASDSWMEELNTNEVVYLPILGAITSTKPVLTTENVAGYMERLRKVVPKGVNFVVVAEDAAVVPVGAEVMMIESYDAPDGKIVAVVFEEGDKPILRRVKHSEDSVVFYADEKNFEPIIKPKNKAHILGIAKRIIVDL